VDPSTGKAGAAAGKQLEGVLNKYDKPVNALADKGKFNIKDANGKTVGSMTGKEIKAVWNGTSFTVTNATYQNGGRGGGTDGTWSGDSFSGKSALRPDEVSGYAGLATHSGLNEIVGLSTLTFHELAHETHFGQELTKQYPVSRDISEPRERGASSAANRMSSAVGGAFSCDIMPLGCQ
jgi:hypothetical protein